GRGAGRARHGDRARAAARTAGDRVGRHDHRLLRRALHGARRPGGAAALRARELDHPRAQPAREPAAPGGVEPDRARRGGHGQRVASARAPADARRFEPRGAGVSRAGGGGGMKRRRSEERGALERQARSALREAARNMAGVERACATALAEAAEVLIACLEGGGTAFFCGNGGSAADAQHLACELAGRYLVDRPGLAAVALTTNSSSLTAIGNDFGYDAVFARQLEGLGT